MAAAPPLPPGSARLLSDMGMRRGRTSGRPTFHAGMDIGHPDGRGTPVLNIQKGVVERVLRDAEPRRGFGGYGNGVVVKHNDDTWALYAHMNGVAVREGQRVASGAQLGGMGNTSNGRFRGMGTHTHLELRVPKRDGSSPFPGRYRAHNIDPRPWLASKGLSFGRRGRFQISEGSEMSETRPLWENLGLFGIDPYPRSSFMAWSLPETSLAGPPTGGWVNEYEPVEHDRDARFGMTPTEWAAAGAGLLVLTGTSVALLMRGRPRANRPSRRRRRRRTSRAARLRA